VCVSAVADVEVFLVVEQRARLAAAAARRQRRRFVQVGAERNLLQRAQRAA